MGEWFVVDWSFILIVVSLALLTAMLAIRHLLQRRRRQRAERRAARHAHHEWLRNSSRATLEAQDPDQPQR